MTTEAVPGKILLVCSDLELAARIRSALVTGGFCVQVAAGGASAVIAALDDLPDLFISDVDIPGKEGWKLFNVMGLVPATRRKPFLFLCSSNTAAHTIRSLRRISDDYLEKPFTVEEMMVKVRHLVERKEEKGEVVPRTSSGTPVCNIEEILIDTVEFMTATGRTGALDVTSGGLKGIVYVEKGRLKHVAFERLTGEDALKQLVSLEEVHVNFREGEVKTLERNVDLNWQLFVAERCCEREVQEEG